MTAACVCVCVCDLVASLDWTVDLSCLLIYFYFIFLFNFSVCPVWWTKLATRQLYCMLNTQYRIISCCIFQLLARAQRRHRLHVCLSVHPSVTRWYWVKSNNCIRWDSLYQQTPRYSRCFQTANPRVARPRYSWCFQIANPRVAGTPNPNIEILVWKNPA